MTTGSSHFLHTGHEAVQEGARNGRDAGWGNSRAKIFREGETLKGAFIKQHLRHV
jgi:hypothetical protein